MNKKEVVDILKSGGIAVIPTDTIFGITASAFNKKAVNKIYKIKHRDKSKPFIILISSLKDLEKFNIFLDSNTKKELSKIWQNKRPISIILPTPFKDLEHLHRGQNSLAFRLPNKSLRSFIKQTGPLVAPSANPESLPPATNIEEAKGYFKNKVDAYYGKGTLKGKASKLIALYPDGKTKTLRN